LLGYEKIVLVDKGQGTQRDCEGPKRKWVMRKMNLRIWILIHEI
jgi:hypothetical protein